MIGLRIFGVRRALGWASLCWLVLALTACAAPESRPAGPRLAEVRAAPEGVYRELAVQGDWLLFEGARTAFGQQLPDGRLWLLERASGSYRLLTPAGLFGEGRAFFASGGAFLPNGAGVVTKVNFDGDGENLYRVALTGERADFLGDAETLGVASIAEATLELSEDGQQLRFEATRVQLLPAAADGWSETRATLTLELSKLPATGARRR